MVAWPYVCIEAPDLEEREDKDCAFPPHFLPPFRPDLNPKRNPNVPQQFQPGTGQPFLYLMTKIATERTNTTSR